MSNDGDQTVIYARSMMARDKRIKQLEAGYDVLRTTANHQQQHIEALEQHLVGLEVENDMLRKALAEDGYEERWRLSVELMEPKGDEE